MTAEKIKVLLISGHVLYEHYYPVDNERARVALESTGKFEVRITEEFNGATATTLEDYDLIYFNYDGDIGFNTTGYIGWTEETTEAFIDFVKSGKGLYLFHCGLDLADDSPEEFKKIWGIYGKRNDYTRKNPAEDFEVRFEEGSPFDSGLPGNFKVVHEDFNPCRFREPGANVKVVCSAYDDADDYRASWETSKALFKQMYGEQVEAPEDLPGINEWHPVAWTNTYGKGRVFAMALGHDYETWHREHYMTLLCRGAEWAATGEVTIEPIDKSEGYNRFKPWPFYGETPNRAALYGVDASYNL